MSLEELAEACEALHVSALFGDANGEKIEDREGCFDLLAEQEFLSALAYLKLAQSAAVKAHYHQVRGRAASGMFPGGAR